MGLQLLEGFAAQVSQAVLRIRATQAQRAVALSAQRMSETLQLSLLTDPPHVPGLQIAVRYQPTAQEALWFHGGNLHQSRHYSQYLALQLKARMEGIPTPVYGRGEVHHAS